MHPTCVSILPPQLFILPLLPDFNFAPSPSWVNICAKTQLLFGLSRSYKVLNYSTVKYIFPSLCHECIQAERRYPGCSALQHQTITSEHISSWVSSSSTVFQTIPLERRRGEHGVLEVCQHLPLHVPY